MKRKKLVSLCLAASMTAGMLAGCGAGERNGRDERRKHCCSNGIRRKNGTYIFLSDWCRRSIGYTD